MNTNTNFSIYPNKITRVAAHLLLWGIVFLISCFVNHESLFRTRVFSEINLISSVFFLLAIIFNHYSFFLFISPAIKKKKWFSTLLFLLLIYIISVYITTFPLRLLIEKYPDNGLIAFQHNRHGVKHVSDVFAYNTFIWVNTVVFFYNAAVALFKTAKDLYTSQREKIHIIQERNAMELNFLRSQIQPHFLFNTLNNIYGMLIDHPKASESILRLSDLLRFSTYKTNRGDVSLAEEIGFLRNYIDLEKMRHKESKVSIAYDFQNVQNLDLPIKPLLLVTFVENAFKHGVNASTRYRWVKINLTEHEGLAHFKVVNNIPSRILDKKKTEQTTEEEGIGQENVRRRLQLEYPDKHTLTIKETEDTYKVDITIKLS